MSDPKYATLPGIAHNQPDVYETSDLPESEQSMAVADEEGSDSVEIMHLDVAAAFEGFKDKSVDGNVADFSDRIRRSHRLGYGTPSSLCLGLAGDPTESNLEKFNRLKIEIGDLIEDCKHVDEGDRKSVNSIMLDELIQLDEQLSSSSTNNLHSQILQQDKSVARGGLKSLLESMHSTALSEDGGKNAVKNAAIENPANSSALDNKTAITYELMVMPETDKLHSQVESARLAVRISHLEKLLGESDDNMRSLSLETGSDTIEGAVKVLKSRSALLVPSHLEHIEGRLVLLMQKINSIGEKKQVLEVTEESQKVLNMYNSVNQIETACKHVPKIVARLEGLQSLHQSARCVGDSVREIEEIQAKISNDLKENENLLRGVEGKFAENLKKISANFESFEARLTKLGF